MTDKKEIVLRKTGGADGFHIFTDENDSLLLDGIVDGHPKGKSTVFHRDVQGFDADIDKNDNVHMIISEKSGNFLYKRLAYGKHSEVYLVDNASAQEKRIGESFIFVHERVISIICEVKNDKECSIIHFLVAEGTDGTALSVGSMALGGSFYVTQNENNDITVLYTDHGTGAFGRKQFIWSEKHWGEFKSLEREGKAVSDVFALCKKKYTDICYKKNNVLCFVRIDEEKNRVIVRSILTKKHTRDASLPILVKNGERLRLLWKSGRTVYMSDTDYLNIRWSRLNEEVAPTEKCLKALKICNGKICGMVQNLGIFDESGFTIFGGERIFEERKRNDGHILKRAGEDIEVFAGMKNNRDYTKDEIEKEKKRIMEIMGIKSSGQEIFGTDEVKNNEIEFCKTPEKTNKGNEDSRYDEKLMSELKHINTAVEKMQNDIEKLKGMLRIYIALGEKRKISVKVHKK